jgi:hypothetical protein
MSGLHATLHWTRCSAISQHPSDYDQTDIRIWQLAFMERAALRGAASRRRHYLCINQAALQHQPI